MKAEEAHKLTAEELEVEVQRLRQKLYDLKSQAVTEKLENPDQLAKTRRDIARLLTEQSSRRLAKSEGKQA